MRKFILSLLLTCPFQPTFAQTTPPQQIFLMAGQSNSANYGEVPLVPSDSRVLAFDFTRGLWTVANDPQPGATGGAGSPWPVFGSILAQQLNTPIGVVSLGVGGSCVASWLPSAAINYPRLQNAVRALKPGTVAALLWHQGECDVQLKTTAEEYRSMVSTIIGQLNQDAGYSIPWFVAEASYVNFSSVTAYERDRMAEIHHGQELLWQSGVAYRGANTDDLVGPDWRWDGIHFNEKGLREHGKRWAAVVQAALYPSIPLRR